MALSAPPLPQNNLPVPVAAEPAAPAAEEGGKKKRGRKAKDPNAPLIPLPPSTHKKVAVKFPNSIADGVEFLGGEQYLNQLVIQDMVQREMLVFNTSLFYQQNTVAEG